jgi:prepilin-type N-terminal cleavage/methylation domain-containing protein
MKTLSRSARGGFTLIEMIISLSIFLLLTAAVFTIFGATMQGASVLQDDNDRGDRTEAMAGWLKKTFLELPAASSVISYARENVPFDVADVGWGDANHFNALDLHLQPDGRYTLRLTGATSATVDQATFTRDVLQDDPSLTWRPLLRDLTAADWRFRPQGSLVWMDSSPGGRPDVVQFTFQIAGAAHEVVDDFWIPRLVPPAAPVLIPAGAVTSNP